MNEFTPWYIKYVETGWHPSAFLHARHPKGSRKRQRTLYIRQGFGNPLGALPPVRNMSDKNEPAINHSRLYCG